MMKIALFVPCYVDQFYPQAAKATLHLLEKLGCTVEYPTDQTCCGQPMANAGYEYLAKGCADNFRKCFDRYEYVVSPSGSCVLHVKEHVIPVHDVSDGPAVMELSEFLTDVLKITSLEAECPYRVGLHNGCHAIRGLGISSMSEVPGDRFSKPCSLLNMVRGLELVPLDREDECCGFGGTFSVFEEAVSVRMGNDRIDDHIRNGAQYITGTDMSCLMHLEGLLKRRKSPVKVVHLAEILNDEIH